MNTAPYPLDASPVRSDAQPVPFATAYVTLTKQEHIRLVMEANSWKSLHHRAVERARWRDQRYRRVLRQLKEQAAQREAVLCAELELALAKIRDLQQRMFGRKSERDKGGSERQTHGIVGAGVRLSHRAGVSLSHLACCRTKERQGLHAEVGGSLDRRQPLRKWLIPTSAPTDDFL